MAVQVGAITVNIKTQCVLSQFAIGANLLTSRLHARQHGIRERK